MAKDDELPETRPDGRDRRETECSTVARPDLATTLGPHICSVGEKRPTLRAR